MWIDFMMILIMRELEKLCYRVWLSKFGAIDVSSFKITKFYTIIFWLSNFSNLYTVEPWLFWLIGNENILDKTIRIVEKILKIEIIRKKRVKFLNVVDENKLLSMIV